MPARSKKKKEKKKVEVKEEKEGEEVGKETEHMVDTQKTSIQISTDLRDRLWKLKFRKTYDEFLRELCDMYESEAET